jgi:predicted transcriptional regulator
MEYEMAVQLTKGETENCILVTLDYLQQNSDYPENGVALKKLAANMNMEVNEVKKFIKELKERNAVRWCFVGTIDGEFYIKTTEQTIEFFEKINALSLNETARLMLEKSYDIYKRAGYDSTFQFESAFIGGIIGITNISKIRSAIEMLDNKGLISNPAIMSDNIIYFISARGIDMIENEPKKQETGSPVFINAPGGNVAVNSSDFKQNINNNELSGYFAILEKLINENIKGHEKEGALNDLETIKELAKADSPNKSLIQRFLSNLGKLPVLLDIVKKVKDIII